LRLTDNGCTTHPDNKYLKTCEWVLEGRADLPLGDYQVSLTVTDNNDGMGSAEASIEVAPRVDYLPLVLRGYRPPPPPPPADCYPVALASVGVGQAPHGVAVNAAAKELYVANHEGDSLSVLDADSLLPVTTVGAGDGPNGVAYHPGRGLIYVANRDDNTVIVLRASDYGLVKTIPVGAGPNGIAANAALDQVYVANFGDGTVSVIDAEHNTVSRTVPVGAEPSMIAVNPVTNKAYVSLHGSGRVAVVDGAGQVSTVDIYDSSGSYGIAVDPVRNLVYVATIDTARIVAIDGSSDTYLGWAQIKRLPGGQPVPLRMIAVNPDIGSSGHIFATTAGSDGGWDKFLLLAKGWPEYFARPYALDLQEPREGIAFDPAERLVYATSRAGNRLAVYEDGEPVCATNFLAPQRLQLEVCVAGPGGRCKEMILR
jgi:YVTN family beta-propeller protein